MSRDSNRCVTPVGDQQARFGKNQPNANFGLTVSMPVELTGADFSCADEPPALSRSSIQTLERDQHLVLRRQDTLHRDFDILSGRTSSGSTILLHCYLPASFRKPSSAWFTATGASTVTMWEASGTSTNRAFGIVTASPAATEYLALKSQPKF